MVPLKWKIYYQYDVSLPLSDPVTFICCEFRAHVPTVQRDEGPTVAHGVAVVGGAEHCDTLAVMEHLVTFLLQWVMLSMCVK